MSASSRVLDSDEMVACYGGGGDNNDYGHHMNDSNFLRNKVFKLIAIISKDNFRCGATRQKTKRHGKFGESQLVEFYCDEAPPLISISAKCRIRRSVRHTQIDGIYFICWYD